MAELLSIGEAMSRGSEKILVLVFGIHVRKPLRVRVLALFF